MDEDVPPLFKTDLAFVKEKIKDLGLSSPGVALINKIDSLMSLEQEEEEEESE